LFRLTRPYLKFSAYNPSYFISFSQQAQSWNIYMPNISNAKKKKKSWSPLPNLFHRVTGNTKHTIIFLGLVCMYLLPHVCIKNIFDLPDAWKKNGFSTDRHKKSHAPLPPSLIKLLVSNKENKWVGRHVTPLGHIN
jgi:hypothetical protein